MRYILAALILLVPSVCFGFGGSMGGPAGGIPSCGVIGDDTEYGSTGQYAGSDSAVVTNGGSDCTANRICLYSAAGGSTSMLLAIYARTSAHQPGALLEEGLVSGTLAAVATWHCASIDEITIEAGTSYYLSWLANNDVQYYYAAGTQEAVYKGMTYASGHDDPYGTVGGNIDRDFSFYVDHD